MKRAKRAKRVERVKRVKGACLYFLKRLFVGGSGGLEEADDVLGAVDDGRLDPKMMAQLLDANLQRRHQSKVAVAICQVHKPFLMTIQSNINLIPCQLDHNPVECQSNPNLVLLC